MSVYKKIVIVGSGEDYSEEKLKLYINISDYIIAVDGGLNILHKMKIRPDILIGDLDSVDKDIIHLFENLTIEKFPTEKDFTDSEIALQKAISFSPLQINLFAMTGSYFDHSLANAMNLFRNYNNNIEINLITSNSIIFPIIQNKNFNHLKNRRISFFPIGNVSGIKLNGFKYNFDQKNISLIDYSISNVISSYSAEISFESGMLICILFDEGFN